MNWIKNKKIYIAGLLVPVLLVFRYLFLSGPLAWGDAPHFFIEELLGLSGDIVPEPFTWISRGHNFGGVNLVVWLHPLMLAYRYFGIAVGNNVAIRVLFYFPAVLLAVVGPILLTRYLKLSGRVQFFASLVYVLNTYFLLLIDGGQVGVALAYGLFPFGLLYLIKGSYWPALIAVFALSIADPRVAVIALIVAFVWKFNVKQFGYYALLVFSLIGLTAYWWFPLVKIGGVVVSTNIAGLHGTSLLDALTLRAPHWPGNIFGEIIAAPFYFIGVPMLILVGVLVRPIKSHLKILLMLLVFSFLAKGSTAPLGGYYDFLLNLPFGFALRDSTKFFIPVVLFSGILIGEAVEKLKLKIGFFEILVYLYLLFLVAPALMGKMNFVLSGRRHSSDYTIIYERLKDESEFFRTVWFPERHPLILETENNPALDAKDLVNNRIFAKNNVGSFDRFNFMHQGDFEKWFDVLGIRYLMFPGDQRKVNMSEEEEVLWEDLESRVAVASGLAKVDWGTAIDVYENSGTMPQVYGVENMTLVVGPMLDEPIPALYVEDGKWNPLDLEKVASESASILFADGKGAADLTMSLLQEYFVGVDEAESKEWAFYDSSEYLVSKYQLLLRDFNFDDFDYGKGIAFSTLPGEKVTFKFKVPAGEYLFVQRKGDLGGDLEWEINELERLEEGEHFFEIMNNGSLSVLNVAALVPKGEYEVASDIAEEYIERFGVGGQGHLTEIEYEKISPVRYKVNFSEETEWVVFTDSYHGDWVMERDNLKYPSLPVYSMVNGFYRRPAWSKAEMVFEGQHDLRWGIWISMVSTLSLGIIYLWRKK